LRNVDRLVLVYLCRPFPSLLDAIIVVKPETPRIPEPATIITEVAA